MKRRFCTLFDKNYLPQLLVLVESLEAHVGSFTIYCFCMDNESFLYLKGLNHPNLILVSHTSLESHIPELITAKSNRSKVEYYFTCTASTCSYVFEHNPTIDLLTYLDADLCFYSSPEIIYHELENYSIGIIAHKFYGLWRYYAKYGKFNVGWVSFKNDENGRKCLNDWKYDCLEWCYDRLENGKYADQKYLDAWPKKYHGVYEIKHPGANLAPWNVGQYQLALNAEDKIEVNNYPLIFYHFANFKQVAPTQYYTSVSKYLVKLSGVLLHEIYLPYAYKLNHYNKKLGYKYLHKERNEIYTSNISLAIKQLSRNIRQILCKDNLSISS